MKEALTDTETRAALARLDDSIHRLWRYGRNFVLAWGADRGAVALLVLPNYAPAEFLSGGESAEGVAGARADAVRTLLDGDKQVTAERMAELTALLGVKPHRIVLPRSGEPLPDARQIEKLVRRYSISRFDDRAVVLFDIVGFSLCKPLEQLTQLNGLAYSINVAHERMEQRFGRLELARTTTGDGFYVWNRRRGIDANIALYHHMHLVLADNAIARSKSKPGLVPLLKTAYHIGSHYEFFQDEDLRPTNLSFIVGDVTIALARMMHSALPAQVMVGDFHVRMPTREDSATRVPMDATGFIDCLQESLDALRGMVLSGERVTSIKCYLTGVQRGDGRFDVTRRRIADKHGLEHGVFNAKINIFREQGAPIFLGLQERELDLDEAPGPQPVALSYDAGGSGVSSFAGKQ